MINSHRNLVVVIPSPIVTEVDIEYRLKAIARTLVEQTITDICYPGDFAVINISTFHNGIPIPIMTASEFLYDTGMNFLPEIANRLQGATAGDFHEIKVSVPAGIVDCYVEVLEIRKQIWLEPTDEVVARFLPGIGNYTEFRNYIHQTLVNIKRAESTTAWQRGVLDVVSNTLKIDVPAALDTVAALEKLYPSQIEIDKEFERMVGELPSQLRTQSMIEPLRVQAHQNCSRTQAYHWLLNNCCLVDEFGDVIDKQLLLTKNAS